jgi:integrase/recombinase XerD
MSRNTVASYCSDIRRFLDLCDLPLKEVGTGFVENYLAGLDRVTKRSQARFLSSLRSFFGWLVMEGIITDNPCDNVDAPKLGRYLPQVLSVEEVEAVIGAVDLSTWQGMRDRAILEVLYGCGLRVSEAVGLKISNLYFDEGYIKVTGKGNKERLIPIGEMAADAINAYLEQRPESYNAASDDLVFLNRFGRSLSRQSMFLMMKKMAVMISPVVILRMTIFSAMMILTANSTKILTANSMMTKCSMKTVRCTVMSTMRKSITRQRLKSQQRHSKTNERQGYKITPLSFL